MTHGNSAHSDHLPRNLGVDLLRATEAAAVSAGRWMGLGNRDAADEAACEAMTAVLNELNIDGQIVIGEETKLDLHSPLDSGQHVGTGRGPALDVVVDPIDGRNLLAQGRSGTIAVAGVAPRGTMWAPTPAAVYMEKIVVDHEAADGLVAECMDAPAAWTLALVARMKDKPVRDLIVFVLDRPRHRELIDEIRSAGARVLLRAEGDIAGALLAASHRYDSADLLMGIGGVPEGVIAACAVKAIGGSMLGRLAPQTPAERDALEEADFDISEILTCDQVVDSRQIFFAASGITHGPLLDGVRYRRGIAETHSLVLSCESGTWRMVRAEHRIE